jgi:hypothetical protein
MWLGLVACVALPALAQESPRGGLGQVAFPTSGSPAAQAHFLRGVAALHSFWYEEALAAFREARHVDPDFAMASWGEAMAHNHPIWHEQDTAAARQVLATMRHRGALTARESAYLNAVKALYGEGDKPVRDLAYAAAMAQVSTDYPDDLEAAAFYALSLLGAVRPADRGYRLQMQAGALALEVYQKQPNHPGAAHYIIHAFDDPDHAILALPAARRYAQIAPAAPHARHMPSHTFIHLGMWPEAAAANESSWAASEAWVRDNNVSIARRDYHSLRWLAYVYLQQGRVREAEAQLTVMRHAMAALGAPMHGYPLMAAAFIAETERWELIDALFGEPAAPAGPLSPKRDSGAGSCHLSAKPETVDGGSAPAGRQASCQRGQHPYGHYVRGLAAAMGRPADAETYVAEMRGQGQEGQCSGGDVSPDLMEIMALEVSALARATMGHVGEAVALLRRATTLEEALRPPSGPPDVIKPSHEVFGEVLLRAGRPAEAAAQFQAALLRQPNRPRSLLGLARAAKGSDAPLAARAYAEYLRTQARADARESERAEARDYLQQAPGR